MATRPRYPRIALVASAATPAVRGAWPRLVELCQRHKVKVYADPATRKVFGSKGTLACAPGSLGQAAPLLLSLGGDGTMLTAARLAAPHGAHVLGVNLGKLGFVTTVPYEHFEQALQLALAGRFRIHKRTMLEALIYSGSKLKAQRLALNDMAVLRGASAKVAEMDVRVDGRELATYRADGLIISTPTGSTAYALSAGGPVVEPSSRNLLLAPISPHTLSARPLVIPDRSSLELTLPRSRAPLSLSNDGERGVPLRRGDRVLIRLYRKRALLLAPPDYDYWENLRAKLGWRGN